MVIQPAIFMNTTGAGKNCKQFGYLDGKDVLGRSTDIETILMNWQKRWSCMDWIVTTYVDRTCVDKFHMTPRTG